ncbi:MAG: 4a-hydroxytetrahydrobiopterin dehydratase [Candidatus Thorarchaeota archaeon]
MSEVVELTPREREHLGLPSYVNKILPVGQALVAKREVPVEPRRDRWRVEQEPERLVRKFTFKDTRVQQAFIQEVLDYEHESQHHGRILIENLNVTVEVWTHDLMRVTEVDIEYAEVLDEIFVDVRTWFRGV